MPRTKKSSRRVVREWWRYSVIPSETGVRPKNLMPCPVYNIGGGWEKRYCLDTGKANYYHVQTGRMQWEVPEGVTDTPSPRRLPFPFVYRGKDTRNSRAVSLVKK